MPRAFPADSVGLVAPQNWHCAEPLTLSDGQTLPEFDLAYETYGKLNGDKSNAILICHALTGDQHVAGYYEKEESPGWWDTYVGPGKAIDTSRFYVVGVNNLGGCGGSTGPATVNPATSRPFGPDFPQVDVDDWVNCQYRLMRFLGLPGWAAVIGGSLGGMQAMRWTVKYPEHAKNCVAIAATLHLTAQNIAFNEIARQAIASDPNFHGGHYLEKNTAPRRGLAIARMVGHITYLSDRLMADKFGRQRQEDKENIFQVESYLRHQGEKFAQKFDANTYLLMGRVLDHFDLAKDYENHARAFDRAKANFLVMSYTSDWRFPSHCSRAIVNALIQARRNVSYVDIPSDAGHDSFLLRNERAQAALSAYLGAIKNGGQHDKA